MSEISEKQFLFNASAKNWKEAVNIAGELLVKNGFAKPAYIDGMLKLTEELGPYIVITPGIAIPHARPEDGAIKPGFSVVKLADPVEFGNPNNDPVHLIIGFCSPNANAHVDFLAKLARILEQDMLLEKITSLQTKKELINLFNMLFL